jgi:hypothetical protein
VTVQLEIKAKDYSTFARLEVWSGNKIIAMHNMNAATTTGTSTVVELGVSSEYADRFIKNQTPDRPSFSCIDISFCGNLRVIRW